MASISATAQALMILSHDGVLKVFMLLVVAEISILDRKLKTLCDEKNFRNYQCKD